MVEAAAAGTRSVFSPIDLEGEDSLVMVRPRRYNFRVSHHEKVGHVVQSVLDRLAEAVHLLS